MDVGLTAWIAASWLCSGCRYNMNNSCYNLQGGGTTEVLEVACTSKLLASDCKLCMNWSYLGLTATPNRNHCITVTPRNLESLNNVHHPISTYEMRNELIACLPVSMCHNVMSLLSCAIVYADIIIMIFVVDVIIMTGCRVLSAWHLKL